MRAVRASARLPPGLSVSAGRRGALRFHGRGGPLGPQLGADGFEVAHHGRQVQFICQTLQPAPKVGKYSRAIYSQLQSKGVKFTVMTRARAIAGDTVVVHPVFAPNDEHHVTQLNTLQQGWRKNGVSSAQDSRDCQAKPFAGVTINGAAFQHVHHTYLTEYLPEFEARTGMKVHFALQAFPVYNQQTDLELSTKGSALDFVNVTFIYSGRWIGAGWLTPLDEFLSDRNATPPGWDAKDFVAGAQSALQDAKGLEDHFPGLCPLGVSGHGDAYREKSPGCAHRMVPFLHVTGLTRGRCRRFRENTTLLQQIPDAML